MSWIKEFYISGKTPFGILPMGCPNCHQPIRLGDEIHSFGYYRHKECHKFIMEIRERLGVEKLLVEKEG